MARYEQLARYLAASVIAHRHGIGLEYAYKRYCKDINPVAQKWLDLAEALDKDAAQTIQRIYGPAFAKPLTDRKQ